MRWLVGMAVLCASFACLGCRDETDGTTPTAEATLPALKLTDATKDLLITWIDERGETHPGTSLSEVPDSARDRVRIVTKDAGHGSLFYVADLTKKQDDGTYPVETMPSRVWEELLQDRRAGYRKKHAPPPVATASSAPKNPEANVGAVDAVVYGAEWCGPCHQAAKYLKKRGAHVVEYDIEKEPDRAREMQIKMKAAGLRGGSIPVIDVGGVMLQGFSTRAIDRAMAKAAKGPTSL